MLADGLRGVHTNDYDYAAVRRGAASPELEQHRGVFTAVKFRTEHPVVRVHPETGERTLILGNFLQKLTGFNGRDSRPDRRPPVARRASRVHRPLAVAGR